MSREQAQLERSRAWRSVRGRARVLVLLVLLLLLPRTAYAKPGEADFRRFTDYVWLLLGAGRGPGFA
jgi:hypothetical protein